MEVRGEPGKQYRHFHKPERMIDQAEFLLSLELLKF